MADMTQSLEDYLEVVQILISSNGSAQVKDVARMLSVKMPSVVKAIHQLKKLGLVTQEPYASICLTEKGSKLAKSVLSRHNLICGFLTKLGVSRKNADRDACRMEHILSAETIDRIRDYMKEKVDEKPD